MDGVYPSSYCGKLPIVCNGDSSVNLSGGVWVSNSFIRNRGQPTFPTLQYDEGWPDYLTNNPPPTQLYVRTAPSQYDKNKIVFWINGWERPRLLLTHGKKYQFNVSTAGNPFYLTVDPQGGVGDKNNIGPNIPSDYFVTTVTINNLPDRFYYQSANTPGMGGEVVII